jgi:tetratricopeptide (TPR) repeat protein
MKLVKNILIVALLAFAGHSYSQEITAKAHAMFQAKDYDSARVLIDAAIQTNEKYNSQTWQLRGLIYRKLEVAGSTVNREIAIESFIEARKTDTTSLYKEKINEYLYNTIIRYYNDAVTYLNEQKYVESEKSYLEFKGKYTQLIDPSKNFVNEDIEYYNALGGGYTKQLGQLSGKDYDIVFALAINALSKVLEADSMNYLANLNTAVMYYNRGADLIVNQDPENTSIDILMENIATAEALFLKALPLMQKAHAINPGNIEVLEGLSGIYYSLNDMDNYLVYQTQLDKINLPKFLEMHQKNPNDKETVRQLVRIYSSTLKDDAQYLKFKTILDQLGG